MSLGPGISGPVHFCRRLFCEPAPLSVVQQTLESVLRKDQERFSSKWNFPLIQNSDKLPSRQPLADQTSNTTPDNQISSTEKVLDGQWQILTSCASFYTSPPRRLKAFRRLNVTVAQKTHSELLKKVQETPQKFVFENTQFKESEEPSIAALPNNTSVPPTPVKNKATSQLTSQATISNSFNKIGTFVHPPLIIKPVDSQQQICEFLPHLVRQSLRSTTSRADGKPILHVVRPRYSEQPVKRKSGAKVTDYFTISKRPRQSLK